VVTRDFALGDRRAIVTHLALRRVHIDAEDHGRRTARTILGLDDGAPGNAPAQVIVRESA
jgi:hypothetical protein